MLHVLIMEKLGDILAEFDAYRAGERQPEYVAELDAALKSKNYQLIAQRFGQRISFGTAGLRARMGFGTACMNSVTVQRAAQGLALYLKTPAVTAANSGHNNLVILGFDARHNSKFFAHLSAAVFIKSGFSVIMAEEVTFTPLTPYMVVKHKAVLGVQVTASHNPKFDNGYKVYAANGAQIIPPMDSEVHSLIGQEKTCWDITDLMPIGAREVTQANVEKLYGPNITLQSKPAITNWAEYQKRIIDDLALKPYSSWPQSVLSQVKVAYTPLHGVGYRFIKEMLITSLGFPESNFYVVESQRDPDPEFPTVPFPNPEEKGALDIAIKLANESGCTDLIANDPDADRFAAGVKLSDNSWRIFTGDEIGSIFGAIMLENARKKNLPMDKIVMICSAVSSKFLSVMCEAEGIRFFETLTGFKWMMNKAIEVQSEGSIPIFAYEEALGYGVSMCVPDKDGVSAASCWLAKVIELRSQGQSMADYLNELNNKYGHFSTLNSYCICHDPMAMKRVYLKFRGRGSDPTAAVVYPKQLAGYPISRIRDVSENYDSQNENHRCDLSATAGGDMITIYFANDIRLTLRGSGTEPKLKYYSECRSLKSKDEAAELLRVAVPAILECLIDMNDPAFKKV